MQKLEIEIPAGHEIDLEKSNLKEGLIVFKKIENKLPKTWKELEKLEGFFVSYNSKIISHLDITGDNNKNIYKTEEQAQASIALAQLSQLREVYRKGWEPNWANTTEPKYCIVIENNNNTTIYNFYYFNCFLSFQTREIAGEFLNNFKDLIIQAKPLMS